MKTITLSLFGCLALGLAPISSLVAEEEIHLASGEVVLGELVKETGDSIEIKRVVLVKHKPTTTSVILQKNQITRREKTPPFPEQYQARLKKTGDALEAQCALARWCLEKCLMEEALLHTRKADALDNDNPVVAKLFADQGYIKDPKKGEWVKEDDYLAQTGLVDFNGKVMTPEEADKRKATIRASAELDAATQAVKDDEWVISTSDEKIKDATDKLSKAKEEQSKAKGDAAGAKSRQESINKRIADRAKKPATNTGGGGYNNNNKNNRNQLSPAEQDSKDLGEAVAALNQANGELASADRATDIAQRRLTQLQQSLDKAKTDLPLAQERKKKAQADLDHLNGVASEKAADDKGADKTAGADKAAADAKVDAKPKSRLGN